MVNSSLAGVAGMGGRLRQLALIGLQHVSDTCLMAALEQLTQLQVGDAQTWQSFAGDISKDGTTPLKVVALLVRLNTHTDIVHWASFICN